MKRVDALHFSLYTYPGEFKFSQDGKMAYLIYEVDIENNQYLTKLCFKMSLEEEGVEIANGEHIKDFFWYENELYICGLLIDDINLEDYSKGIPLSSLYKYSESERTMEKLFTVDRYISRSVKISNDRWLLACADNLNNLKLWEDSNSKEEYVSKKNFEFNFLVAEEWPINSDSGGFRSGDRTRLYIWDQGNLSLVTEKFSHVVDFSVYKENYVILAVNNYKDVQPTTSKLWILDLVNLEKTLLDPKEYVYTYLEAIDEEFIGAIRNDRENYGEYQDEYIDKISIADGSFVRLNEKSQYHLCNSFNVDITYGASAQRFLFRDDSIYFLATKDESTNIYHGSFKEKKVTELVKVPDFMSLDFQIKEEDLIILGMENLDGPEYWHYERKANKIKKISNLNGDISKEYEYSQPQIFNITNDRDGVEIRGYLMKPLDFEFKKSYPLVLYIHGGPNTSYNGAFYHEAQLVAANGCAVAFCNPRGSSGRGPDFADLRKRYYTVDRDDILDFLSLIVKEHSWIDRKRLGVSGGSYGGMMVNNLISTSNLFSFAISDRSICNESLDFFCSDIGLTFNVDTHGGLIWDEKVEESMRSTSWIYFAPKIKTPTLFIHGELDYRCTKEQSFQMFSALKFCGVETRLFIAKGENHSLCWSGSPIARQRRLEEIVNWIKKFT